MWGGNSVFIKRSVLLLTAACLYAAQVTAAPTPKKINEAISDKCEVQHMMSGMSTQSEIEADCPAGQEGSQFVTSRLSERQATFITDFLYALLLGATREGMLAPSPFDAPKVQNIPNGNYASGLNAGTTLDEVLGGLSVWGSLSHTSVENDFVNTPWDSDSNNLLIGAHSNLNDNMILGATFGYESTGVDTFFNAGKQEVDGFTVAGYFGWLVNDWISFDVAGGLSYSDIEQRRAVSAFEVAAGTTFAPLGAGAPVTSNIDTDTWFVSTNLTAFKTFDKWIVDGHVGYLRAETDQDASTEIGGGLSESIAKRSSELGQFRIGVNVGYQWQNNMEPFVGLDYINDHTFEKVTVAPGLEQPANDDDEVQATAGFRYFGEHLNGILQFRNNFGRDDIDTFSIEAMISAEF